MSREWGLWRYRASLHTLWRSGSILPEVDTLPDAGCRRHALPAGLLHPCLGAARFPQWPPT